MNKLNKKKGFTLAELLVVVAIIAVLVAISIPIFTSQLEKSRESVDLANTRAAYAEVMTAALTDDKTPSTSASEYTISYTNGTWKAEVNLTQKEEGWKSTIGTIGGVTPTGTPTNGGKATIEYNGTTTTVVFS